MSLSSLLTISVILLFASFILILMIRIQRLKMKQAHLINELTQDYEKAILNSKIEIQEATINNIGRELHDNIGSLMTVIIMNLSGIDLEKKEESKTIVHDTKILAKETNEKLKNLSATLNSENWLSKGFGNALLTYLSPIQKTGNFELAVEFSNHDIRFNLGKEIMLFRICQEIISNIIKHSKAKKVKVSISYSPADLKIKIADDGIGFDTSAVLESNNMGMGLKNILKRAKIINASVEIVSEIGRGTTINIELPI